MSSYAHAVISPFDESAFGAQVPDLYVFPSDAQHFRTSFFLGSDENGSWDLIINPNLLHTVYSSIPHISGSMPLQYNINNARSGAGVTQAYGICSDFSDIKQYRIVGMGFRMSSLLVPMSSTGTITMATLPTAEFVPSKNVMDALATSPASLGNLTTDYNQNPANQYATCLTAGWCDPTVANINTTFNIIGSDGLINPIIQTLPTGKQMTHFEFNESGIDWATRVTDSAALQFREIRGSKYIYNGTYIFHMTDIVDQSKLPPVPGVMNTGASLESGFPSGKDMFANGGFTQLLLRGIGFPPLTQIANCELIFHVEIINNKLTNLSSATIPVINKGYLDEVLDTAARFPFYRSIRGPDKRDMFSRLGITNL